VEKILRLPHLVLSDVGDNHAVAFARQVPQLSNDKRWHQLITFLGKQVTTIAICPPLGDLVEPGSVLVGLHQWYEFTQCQPCIAHQGTSIVRFLPARRDRDQGG